MMDEALLFGSREYNIFLGLMVFSRAMDFLSTWIATPNLVLEANPLAKKLRWKWGIPLNIALCVAFAAWPLVAIVISTTSVLVAARNFQLAWLMRTAGEENYREWFMARLEETPVGLFLFCVLAQTLLTAGVGGVLMYFSWEDWGPFRRGFGPVATLGIGMGIVGYAVAVTLYTFLGLWRNRTAWRYK